MGLSLKTINNFCIAAKRQKGISMNFMLITFLKV